MPKLRDLTPDSVNINAHSQRGRYMTEQSVRKFGSRLPGVLDKHGTIIDGNERSEVYAEVGLDDVQIVKADPSKPLFVQYDDLDLSDPTNPARELQIALHRSAVTSFAEDGDALLTALANGLDVSDWYRPEELDAILDALNAPLFDDTDSAGDTADDAPLPLERADVPDAVWPTDNDWGVPLLDLNMQALAFDQPHAIWGSVAQTKRMAGTWLFYTSDDRYEALWTDPSPVLNTGAIAAVEPNFSVYRNMPAAVALWQIYRKRWIARWWQSHGLRVWVDLNVAHNHYGLNHLGIPQGWRAFATRGYTARLDEVHAEYEQACKFAGEGVTPLFLVVGGGKEVKAECMKHGWLWVTEDMDKAKGREV